MSKETILDIKEAFVQLLKEKPFDSITVKDIVERSGVNRNTFYYHFADISELVKWVSQDAYERNIQDLKDVKDVKGALYAVYGWFKEFKNVILNVYNSQDKRMVDRYCYNLSVFLANKLTSELFKNDSDIKEQYDFMIKYYTAMYYGATLMMLDAGIPDRSLDFIDHIYHLVQITYEPIRNSMKVPH